MHFIYIAHTLITDVSTIGNLDYVEDVQQQISSALVRYTNSDREATSDSDKFAQLLLKLPDIKLLGAEIKQFLCAADADLFDGALLDGCLLGEMLYGPSSTSSMKTETPLIV